MFFLTFFPPSVGIEIEHMEEVEEGKNDSQNKEQKFPRAFPSNYKLRDSSCILNIFRP